MTAEQINIVAFILTPLVALGFFILGLTAKRPKLRSEGSGAGSISPGGADVMASNITVRNQPTVFGLRVVRDPAKIESARLYDPDMKEYVGSVLRWRDDGNKGVQRYTIGAGKQGKLYIFAKERHSDEYFVFSPTALDAPLPEHRTVYKDRKRDFVVVLRDEVGRQYRFPVTARNSDQSVSIRHKLTLHRRVGMLREALSLVRGAVTPSR